MPEREVDTDLRAEVAEIIRVRASWPSLHWSGWRNSMDPEEALAYADALLPLIERARESGRSNGYIAGFAAGDARAREVLGGGA